MDMTRDHEGNTSITSKVSKVPASDGKCTEVHFMEVKWP